MHHLSGRLMNLITQVVNLYHLLSLKLEDFISLHLPGDLYCLSQCLWHQAEAQDHE